jgi:hypothetical protein
MHYTMYLPLLLASLRTATVRPDTDPTSPAPLEPALADVVQPALQRLLDLAQELPAQPLSPAKACSFEQQLHEQLRELGRTLTQWAYNHVEPAPVADLPSHVSFAAGLYTRLTKKTPQNVWTLFGQIRLWRVGYRPTCKSGAPTIFPLALGLGLVQGASPALAERAARLLGGAGMTQRLTLQRLRQDCGVGWGVKKLRQVTEAVARAVAEQRPKAQAKKLLELLEQATASRGRHKPVLSVGRDGITLGLRYRRCVLYEVATTGTIAVLDRRGKRLGTVYLAHVPEPGQATMSRELSGLLHEVLRRWSGPLPRLCYVSDAGDSETKYYNEVLSRMEHPVTGEQLEWVRVVDYYHASERIGTMAEQLFGKGRRALSWTRKMQKWLLLSGGVNRVLHSAAALRTMYKLKGKKQKEFKRAYRYLRKRMKYMRYAEYQRVGVPRGSGVTEAGCKTVYTQRLKLSGMRWKKPGAQTVLNLRVLLLSGAWDEAYQGFLNGRKQPQVWGQSDSCKKVDVSAA